MKKNLLLSFYTFLAGAALAQTNLNFENWTGNNPQGWTVSNDVTTLNGGAQTVFKETSSPGQGTSSLKMVTGSCPACPTYLSDNSWGLIDCTLPNPYGGSVSYGTDMEPGIPYTSRPISIDFLYKSKPANNDEGGIGVELTKYNSTTGENDKIGEAYFTSDVEVSEWTHVNIPVVYYSNLTPDTLNIYAASSIGTTMDCSNSNIFPNMPSPYTDWGLPYPVSGSEFYLDAIVINLPSCAGLTLSVTGTKETSIGASDGTASANAGGGAAPYSYSWSNLSTTQSISGLIPGQYYVTVTDNNQCQKVGSYFVAPGGCNLTVNVTGTYSNSNSIYNGTGSATANASGGNGPYDFEWNTGQVNTGVTSSSVSNLAVGTYAVLVTEQNNPNCAMWGTFTVFGPSTVGVISPSKVNSRVMVFPNPAATQITFKVPEENAKKILLFDLVGKVVKEINVSGQTTFLEVSDFSEGIYYYNITATTGEIISNGKFSLIK